MLWVPTVRLLVGQVAVLTLPEPAVNATALHPVIAGPASAAKLTLPEGFVPVTVAAKVTDVPNGAGLPELASVVVVGAGATVDVSRTSSTKPVKSLPVPTPVRVNVWLPVVAIVNAGVW